LRKVGYGALRPPIGNEVSLLWEWLPATIIAARCRSHRAEKDDFIGKQNSTAFNFPGAGYHTPPPLQKPSPHAVRRLREGIDKRGWDGL